MSRKIKTTELLGSSFGVKVNHKNLLERNIVDIYRVSFNGKSTYVDSVPITLEQLESMKEDIDKVIRDCKRIIKEEEVLKEIDFDEVQE